MFSSSRASSKSKLISFAFNPSRYALSLSSESESEPTFSWLATNRGFLFGIAASSLGLKGPLAFLPEVPAWGEPLGVAVHTLAWGGYVELVS